MKCRPFCMKCRKINIFSDNRLVKIDMVLNGHVQNKALFFLVFEIGSHLTKEGKAFLF